MKKLLTKLLGDPLEGTLNSILSLVRDKTKDSDMSFIREKVRKGISISSKRVLNLGITSSAIIVSLSLMNENGINAMNLILLGLGMLYSLGMSFITSC